MRPGEGKPDDREGKERRVREEHQEIDPFANFLPRLFVNVRREKGDQERVCSKLDVERRPTECVSGSFAKRSTERTSRISGQATAESPGRQVSGKRWT